jgi:glycine/D-amino acid oxidase-like deaminating enzyme
MQNGELGFWWRSLGGPPARRPALPGPAQADVAIVGAGYTGLWSAYYLKRADPSLDIVVLEAETAGYGASGRNGGWVSGFFHGAARRYGGEQRYALVQRAMFATVDEIAAVLDEHGIDADFVKHGHLTVAIGTAQLARLREHVAASRHLGLAEADLHELNAAETAERLRVAGALGGAFTPHVARVHPAKLVRGLAQTVETLGVRIYEGTPVSEIRPRLAITPVGAVQARWVIRATEGYTSRLAGLGRALLPMNSSMIVTEPLPQATWEEIGWEGGEPLDDAANVYVYLQRTADGRIAIGGRGVPYRFGSSPGGSGETPAATAVGLRAQLHDMFPATRDAQIEHAWAGVLGVPRDWGVSVAPDPATGLAWGGGYTGLGVAASNLVGRTLCDLVLGKRTKLTALPWVGRAPRRWEPEPLRWLAVRSAYALYRRADRMERRSGRPSRLAKAVDLLTGRS